MKHSLLLFIVLLAACGTDGTAPPAIIPELSIIAGNAQTDTIGKTLATQITAALTDKASGAPLAGRIVNWVVVEGGGQVFAAVVQTGADGMARQQWTLGMTPGSQKLVARWLNPDTGEPVTLDTAYATALPRPTFYLVNTSPDNVTVDIAWRTGETQTVSTTALAPRCAFLAFVGDSATLTINRGGSVFSTGALALGAASTLTVAGNGWGWASSATCSPA
jgi:hypothetical protein